MRHVLVALAACAAATGLAGSAAARQGGATCVSGSLVAVAATSPVNAWAVGTCTDDGQILIEHWDGQAWTVQPMPSVGYESHLTGVAAASTSDVWAVGFYDLANTSTTRTLIEHWNGTTWAVQPSPNPTRLAGVHYDELTAVAATSATNAWAVGVVGGPTALIEHWNGTSWQVQRAPKTIGNLYGVAATSPTNAWFVGTSEYIGGGPVIGHWDGRTWKAQLRSKKLPALAAVAASSTRNAWAVGGAGTPGTSGTTVEWMGDAWRSRPSPRPVVGATGYSQLAAVAATSPTNAWAVGGFKGFGRTGPVSRAIIERWNGSRWTPQQATQEIALLAGVAATSPTNAWAVGVVDGPDGPTALIEHWEGQAWRVQPG